LQYSDFNNIHEIVYWNQIYGPYADLTFNVVNVFGEFCQLCITLNTILYLGFSHHPGFYITSLEFQMMGKVQKSSDPEKCRLLG
jgi:hypothetical protein